MNRRNSLPTAPVTASDGHDLDRMPVVLGGAARRVTVCLRTNHQE
jgi:hypothetical protein